MSTVFSINNYIKSHIEVFSSIKISEINVAIEMIDSAFKNGKKIAVCGNGGSALTASHYITDWNKMINLVTGKKFMGICLSDNIGQVTAYANDLSYDDIYSEQIKNILDPGDLLIGISGSGNSENIVKAIKKANEIGIKTLSICGFDGGKIKDLANNSIWINSFDMQLCEDAHMAFGHIVMKHFCGSDIN